MDGGHEGGGGPDAVELSAYELERLANIMRNQAVLVALGLPAGRQPMHHRRRRRRRERELGSKAGGGPCSLNSPLAFRPPRSVRPRYVPGSYAMPTHTGFTARQRVGIARNRGADCCPRARLPHVSVRPWLTARVDGWHPVYQHPCRGIHPSAGRERRTDGGGTQPLTRSSKGTYTKPGQPGRIQLHYLQRAGITVWGSATQPTGIWRWTSPLICGPPLIESRKTHSQTCRLDCNM